MVKVKFPVNLKDVYFLKDDKCGNAFSHKIAKAKYPLAGQLIKLNKEEWKGLQDMIIVKLPEKESDDKR